MLLTRGAWTVIITRCRPVSIGTALLRQKIIRGAVHTETICHAEISQATASGHLGFREAWYPSVDGILATEHPGVARTLITYCAPRDSK